MNSDCLQSKILCIHAVITSMVVRSISDGHEILTTDLDLTATDVLTVCYLRLQAI